MKKWKKWLSVGVLSAMLGAGGMTAQTVYANVGLAPQDRSSYVSPNEGVPAVGAAEEAVEKAWKKIKGVCYNGSGEKVEGAITRGMDVSEWQGTINWKEARKDLDFAFVRISYGANRIDYQYEYNMTQAEAAGVPVGTYVYSLARSTQEALQEAQTAITKMQGHKVSYPVVFDLEDEATLGTCSPSEVSRIALAFCGEVAKAGYTPMLYMNLNWYNNYVDWSVLEGSGLDVWIACYGDHILAPDSSRYKYTIWQPTAGDEVPGMISTKKLIRGVPEYNNVDLDFGYVDYTKKIVPRWKAKEDYVPAKEVKNGWSVEKKYRYYYVNNTKVTGWKEIDGKNYCFSKVDGHMYKSKLIVTDEGAYYVDKNGVQVKRKFVTKDGNTYYFGSDGKAKAGMSKIAGKYYYFNKKTYAMEKNYKHMNPKGIIYYFDKNGVRVTNKLVKIKVDGKTKVYYFGSNGKAYKGWHTINGNKYYFHRGKGADAGTRAQHERITNSAGLVSVFNKYGICIKQYKE